MMSLRSFAAVLATLLICVLPHGAFAATSSDGTTCTFVLNSICYVMSDTGTVNKGTAIEPTTPSTPGFDPNQIDTSKLTGCQIRSNIPNIGYMTTIGGPYVPVSDLAVTKNTGYLVYKTCVLDALAAKMKEAATAKITQDTLKLINEGDDGNPLFVQNLGVDRVSVANRVVTEYLKDYNTGSLCSSFKDEVRTNIIRTYLANADTDHQSFSCSFDDSEENAKKLQAFYGGGTLEGGGWSTWWSFAQNPANSPLFAYVKAKQELDARIGQAQADRATQLEWGNGFVPREKETSIPQEEGDPAIRRDTVTPGVILSGAVLQATQSGFNQLQMAESMDGIINSGYAALSAQIIASPSGLVGVTKPQVTPGSGGQTGGTGGTGGGTGGQSYLDQILQAILGLIQKGIDNSGNNGGTGTTTPPTALIALNAALRNEQDFLSARQQVQAYLAAQSQNFVTTQNTCWVKLAQAVTIKANGAPFRVATTSTYSTTAINDVLTPFKTVIDQDINVATTSIKTLSLLVSSVASSTNPTVGQTALSTLSVMGAQKVIHTPAEVEIAKNNITEIQTAVGTRVSATMTAWKEGNGWCNASSTAVVQSWFDTWKI